MPFSSNQKYWSTPNSKPLARCQKHFSTLNSVCHYHDIRDMYYHCGLTLSQANQPIARERLVTASDHYIDVIMTTMASQITSLTVRLFTQPFIQTQIKENIKAPRHWPLCGEFTGTGEFPAQRASYAENVSIWWRHQIAAVIQPAGSHL